MQPAEALTLPTKGAIANLARRYVVEQLMASEPSVVADAQLIVTELVTNAQLHGEPPVILRVRSVGAGARVEVQDSSPRQLIRPVQSTDAMTGRGLALVAALADSWGADPAPRGGKTVWVELSPGQTQAAEDPVLDVDAFLAAWHDDDAPREPEYSVRLGSVPTGLLLEAKRHVDNIVRELTFEQAAAGPVRPELELLIETVTRGFSRARAGIKEQAAAAASRQDHQTELVLTLPASSVQAGERYLVALDEVDRYARQARLLTLETPPLHRLFRHWYVSALVEQLRAQAAGELPPEPTPFVEVLVNQVGELASLREAAHRLDLLQRVNAELTIANTAEDMARVIISAAAEELGAVTARVYVTSTEGLRAVGQSAAPTAGVPAFDNLPFGADLPGSLVFRMGEPLVLRDLGHLLQRFPQLTGVYDSERSLHVVPIAVQEHRLGVLALGFVPSSRYDEADQTAYVRAFADALAQGLERIDAAERLAAAPQSRNSQRAGSAHLLVGGEGERRLKSLAQAAGAIAGARTVEALLQVVSEAARSIVGVHQSVASRLYEGTWDHAATHVSLSDDYAQWRAYDVVPEGRGVLNFVTRENKPLRLTGLQLLEHPEFRGLRDAPGHPPLPDYLAAPLISRDGRNIGLVQLSHKVDGTEFDEADEATAVQLALMVSAALEHVETTIALQRALESLRGERELIESLHRVGQAVTARLEHSEVVQVVTDAATAMTGAQFGAFFYNVIDDHGESYALYTISGVPREAFEQFPMPRNTDIFAPTFAGDGVLRSDDITTDPRYGHLAPHHGMPKGHLPVSSYLAVPVQLAGGDVIGGLFFGHSERGVFDENAERIAVGIAAYAAIALENGRLYDAARRESRAKDEIAAALERPLQPLELPAVPSVEVAAVFQPFGGAGNLGGDFYDLFPLSEGRWMVALGDVAGKGPEAAALTGLVRHTLWGAAQHAREPAAVAQTVNEAMLRLKSERFVTLVIAVLTPTSDGLDVAGVWAGHPAAVLLTSSGPRLVSGSGMPVGLFPDPGLETVRFSIGNDETMLLYTDGLLDRQGHEIAEEEIVELLAPHASSPLGLALEGLLAEVGRRFPPRDDIAALALRPLGSVLRDLPEAREST